MNKERLIEAALGVFTMVTGLCLTVALIRAADMPPDTYGVPIEVVPYIEHLR